MSARLATVSTMFANLVASAAPASQMTMPMAKVESE